MPDHVLAIDAGTTSVRTMIVDGAGIVRARARQACDLSYPKPGLVEQDPEALWQLTRSAVDQVLRSAGISRSDLAAIGITSQRSCSVVWHRASGLPAAPLVSWQDLRGMQRALEFQQMGIPVQPQSAAAKLESVVDSIPDARNRIAKNELAWGNVDSYLIARLTNGAAHITDPSQACATAYFDYETGGWSHALLNLQRFPEDFFPRLVDTAALSAETDAKVFSAAVPIAAIVGDQQSAAIAQGCNRPGMGKVTFGTSGTCNVNTGDDVLEAPGTYPLVLQRINGKTVFCLEGMVITAGAMFEWLAHGLGIVESPAATEALARSVSDSGGVYVLPALQGIGTPHFDFTRTAEIGGLTRGASKAHIVRAAMEGVAFRIREMVETVYRATGLPTPPCLRVDGGAAANDLFMQIQADALGLPVERMDPLEATGWGAAVLAGQGAGMWDEHAVDRLRSVDRVFQPAWNADERDSKYQAWRAAARLTSPA